MLTDSSNEFYWGTEYITAGTQYPTAGDFAFGLKTFHFFPLKPPQCQHFKKSEALLKRSQEVEP